MIIHKSHYEISSNMDSVIFLSETLQEDCYTNSVPEDATILIRIALVEALNNIVEHSFEHENFHKIDVYFTILPQNIRIRLEDNGHPNLHGIEPYDIVVSPNDIMSLPTGKYGLNIIHQVMDYVDYNRHNNINVMTMEKFLIN